MKVLITSTNLIWSARLKSATKALGHQLTSEPESADVAIVALSEQGSIEQVSRLVAMGKTVIGHAGHKETEVLDAARDVGCQKVVSNGEIASKLKQVLEGVRVAG